MSDIPAGPLAAPASRRTQAIRSLWAEIRARPHVVPLAILFTSFLLLPPEAYFVIAGLNFPVFRFAALAFVGWGIYMFGSDKLRFGLVDTLVLVSSLWTVASFLIVYNDTPRAIPAAASNWLDIAGAYIIARASIRSPDDLRLLLRLIVVQLAIAGLFLVLESVGGEYLVRPFFAEIFGAIPQYIGGETVGTAGWNGGGETRLGGFLRAFSFFSHPILAGSILSACLAPYWFSGLSRGVRAAGVMAALASFFSMSSAAMIALALSIALVGGDYIVRRLQKVNWWVVASFVILIALLIQVGSQNGLINVVIRMTFEPQTAYYRLLIWQFGSDAVLQNPWFGIGYAEYDRPRAFVPSSSVDAHFLALALSNGLVAAFALFAAGVATIVKLSIVVSSGRGRDRDLLFAVVVAFIVLMFASMTVSYFQEARIWFMAWLGITTSLGHLRVKTVSAVPALGYSRYARPARPI